MTTGLFIGFMIVLLVACAWCGLVAIANSSKHPMERPSFMNEYYDD